MEQTYDEEFVMKMGARMGESAHIVEKLLNEADTIDRAELKKQLFEVMHLLVSDIE